MKKKKLIIVLAVVLSLFLLLIPQNNLAHTEEEPMVVDMVTCRSNDLGDISVWNDEETLYVCFDPADDWKIVKIHLAVELTLEDIPTYWGKIPKLFCFEFKSYFYPPEESFCYEIPIQEGWEIDTDLYIAAHALLMKKVIIEPSCSICEDDNGDDGTCSSDDDDDDDDDDDSSDSCDTRCDTSYNDGCYCKPYIKRIFRGVWGEGEKFSCWGKAMYFTYTLQGDEPTLPSKPVIEIPSQADANIQLVFAPTTNPDRANAAAPSYFDIQLFFEGEYDNIVSGEWYDGWCADKTISIDGYTGSVTGVKLYSSTDLDSLPWYAKDDEQWDRINYILNNKVEGASWRDISQAIWCFADAGYTLPSSASTAAITMYENARDYGAGFVPSPGDMIAVIIDVNDGTTQTNQLVFIEVDP